MAEACIFCEMAQGKRAVQKLYEDELVFAIRDIYPKAPTHILLIPKEHIPTANDLRDDHAPLLASLYRAAREVARKEGVAQRGYRLTINVGPWGGQGIFHLHMHLLGGRPMGAEG